MVYLFVNAYQKPETLANESHLSKPTKTKLRKLFRLQLLNTKCKSTENQWT